jgi:hypothetical protein|tara:strand:- start:105 stop:479 length:375 start_codon:yes stop_codon:yes gene_type:complete
MTMTTVEYFAEYRQGLITAIEDYETAREALRSSRSDVHKYRQEMLKISDEFEIKGPNQAERDKEFRRKVDYSEPYKGYEQFMTDAAELVAIFEGRVEAQKYKIRLHELELKFLIAHTEGTNNDD